MSLKNALRAQTIFAGPAPATAAAPSAEDDDPIAVSNRIASAWEEFKAANDQRLDEIQSRFKSADVLQSEKVTRISDDILKLQGALDDHIKKMARLEVGGAANDDRPDLLKETQLFLAARSEKPVQEEDVTPEQIESYRNYRRAFTQFLRRGGDGINNLPADIRNEMSSGSDADGGYLVPTEFDQRVRARMFETSDVRAVAEVVTISTEGYEFLTDPNSAASGGWVSEKASRPETATPQIGKQTIPVHEQYAEPHVTQRLIDDAAIDVEDYLSRKIADILERTENTAFVTGDGTGAPRGFLDYGTASVTTDDASRNWGILQHLTTGVNGDFAASDKFDKMLELVYKLKPMYRANARWAMRRSIVGEVMQFKDGQGNYLWKQGNIVTGQPQTLGGWPIAEMEDMPAKATDSFSVAFGDFRAGYIIVDRQGINVLRDPFTSKPFVKFYTTKRVGGDVQDFDAIKLLKFSA